MPTNQPKDTGRTSSNKGTKAALADWKVAEEQQAIPPEPGEGGGEWVPVRAIWKDSAILPRTAVDESTVLHYMEILDELPPITVQQSTFKLLDGANRLEATARAGRPLIRITEEAVPDEVAWERAAELNRAHGLPLNQRERVALGKRYLAEHPDLPTIDIARWAGVDWHTVAEWRKADAGKTTREQERRAAVQERRARQSEAEQEAALNAQSQAERDATAAQMRELAAGETADPRAEGEARDPNSTADGGFPPPVAPPTPTPSPRPPTPPAGPRPGEGRGPLDPEGLVLEELVALRTAYQPDDLAQRIFQADDDPAARDMYAQSVVESAEYLARTAARLRVLTLETKQGDLVGAEA